MCWRCTLCCFFACAVVLYLLMLQFFISHTTFSLPNVTCCGASFVYSKYQHRALVWHVKRFSSPCIRTALTKTLLLNGNVYWGAVVPHGIRWYPFCSTQRGKSINMHCSVLHAQFLVHCSALNSPAQNTTVDQAGVIRSLKEEVQEYTYLPVAASVQWCKLSRSPWTKWSRDWWLLSSSPLWAGEVTVSHCSVLLPSRSHWSTRQDREEREWEQLAQALSGTLWPYFSFNSENGRGWLIFSSQILHKRSWCLLSSCT